MLTWMRYTMLTKLEELYMGDYGDELVMTNYNELWRKTDFRPTHQADTYGITYRNAHMPDRFIVVNNQNMYREV